MCVSKWTCRFVGVYGCALCVFVGVCVGICARVWVWVSVRVWVGVFGCELVCVCACVRARVFVCLCACVCVCVCVGGWVGGWICWCGWMCVCLWLCVWGGGGGGGGGGGCLWVCACVRMCGRVCLCVFVWCCVCVFVGGWVLVFYAFCWPRTVFLRNFKSFFFIEKRFLSPRLLGSDLLAKNKWRSSKKLGKVRRFWQYFSHWLPDTRDKRCSSTTKFDKLCKKIVKRNHIMSPIRVRYNSVFWPWKTGAEVKLVTRFSMFWSINKNALKLMKVIFFLRRKFLIVFMCTSLLSVAM